VFPGASLQASVAPPAATVPVEAAVIEAESVVSDRPTEEPSAPDVPADAVSEAPPSGATASRRRRRKAPAGDDEAAPRKVVARRSRTRRVREGS
jgi:hypothetical protein